MKRTRTPLALLFCCAGLMGGCASQPSTASASAPPPSDCRQLEAEISATEKAKRAALEKQHSAWKAVVPFVVAAHHARARSEVAGTDKRLTGLRAESARRGCTAART